MRDDHQITSPDVLWSHIRTTVRRIELHREGCDVDDNACTDHVAEGSSHANTLVLPLLAKDQYRYQLTNITVVILDDEWLERRLGMTSRDGPDMGKCRSQ